MARPGASRGLLLPLRSSSELRKRISKILILVVIDPVEGVEKASAGVPLFWPGTDVLIDPGDEHGGIVSLGTGGDA
jgi:hypothetical protein